MNRDVWLLALCQALLNTGNVLLVSVNALIGQQLAPSEALITLPVAFQFVGLMLATIPASLIMQRIGRRNGFLLGNCIGLAGAITCLLALQVASFSLFCLGTSLLGVGIGFGMLYRFAAVEVCEKGYESRAISMVMLGGIIAAVLGPNLAVYSRSVLWEVDFSGAFAVLAGVYLLALMLLMWIRIPPMPRDIQGSTRPLKIIMLQPRFLMAVLAGMVSFAVMNLLMTATPLAMGRCGYSFSSAANVIEWHVLGMYLPSFFTGHLIRRYGEVLLMKTGAVIMLICIAINLHGQTEWHFWTALLLLGVGWNWMFICATSFLTKAYEPAEKAKAQAANEFLVFGMVTCSALAAGWLEASVGWATMNVLMIPVVAITLVALFMLESVRRDAEAVVQPLKVS
ncbi:MFS transporter [Marinobacterium sediminicola]|uniref:Predicted arabinose efflux permease, MFS family n=1 Tax=Marinobacterium sediminicola TaxID=518898 RepID=A0ABY1RWV8_9GAMM|nr:MFS transporter [Marinobacterium sediminicola]ULG67939.1 MFS transporter [Marinobacterium sediminicola]SMR71328.1 Predicted arabinose efflux permease, MFS family [Marinobacterium sediminicola]